MKTRCVESIQELPEKDWDTVAGSRLVLTHAWQRVMEESANDYHPRYLLLEDDTGPVALCIAAHWDGGPLWERTLLRRSLRIFAPYGASASGIATRPGVALESVLRPLDEALAPLRRERLCLVSVVTVSSRQDADALESQAYQTLAIAPDTVMDVPGGSAEEYLASLAPKDRRFVGRGRRLVEKQGLELVIEPVRGDRPELYELYVGTARHHGLPPGEAPPFNERLFQAMSTHLGERARLFLYRNAQTGQPHLFIMGATNGRQLITPFAGLRYGSESLGNFYRSIWHEVAMWAAGQGIQRIHAGTTNYKMKQSLGYQLAHRWLCYRANTALLRPLVERARPLVERFGYRVEAPSDPGSEP